MLFVATSSTYAQDNVIESLQGEWTLLSMTKHGGKVTIDEIRLAESSVVIKGDELSMNKYWQLLPRNYNPETKTAEGYLDGDPGYRFSIEFGPKANQMDLIVKGLVPASAEDDLSDSEKEVFRDGTARFAGIYSLKGETLTICFDEKVPSQRPTHFSGKEGSDQVRVMLERKKP
ncbi:MAG: TIGR03067 domain-containing protein [Planctomycetes bacterium]|nr:TIGR03067 domain-containing protein [Planctomycetota bacterium]